MLVLFCWWFIVLCLILTFYSAYSFKAIRDIKKDLGPGKSLDKKAFTYRFLGNLIIIVGIWIGCIILMAIVVGLIVFLNKVIF